MDNKKKHIHHGIRLFPEIEKETVLFRQEAEIILPTVLGRNPFRLFNVNTDRIFVFLYSFRKKVMLVIVANTSVSVAGKFPLEIVSDKPLLIYQSYRMPDLCKSLRIVDKLLDRSNLVASPLIVLPSDAIKKLLCSANNQDCSSLISFWLRLWLWFFLCRYFVPTLPRGLRTRSLGNIRIVFSFRTHPMDNT